MKDLNTLVPLFVLEILRKYSSKKHLLNNKKILEYINRDYNLTLTNDHIIQRAIKNISNESYGYHIHTITGRNGGSYIETPYGLNDIEIHQIKDIIAGSNALSNKATKDLTNKILKLGGIDIHTDEIESNSFKTKEKDINDALNKLRKAINKKLKVRNKYGYYNEKHILEDRSHYEISPYKLVALNNKYYLITSAKNTWRKDGKKISPEINPRNFRVDHILEIEILGSKQDPVTSIKSFEKGLDNIRVTQMLPYMTMAEPKYILFYVTLDYTVDQLIDYFGDNIKITKQKGQYQCEVTTSPLGMQYLACQYSDIRILKPNDLKESVIEELEKSLEYKKN